METGSLYLAWLTKFITTMLIFKATDGNGWAAGAAFAGMFFAMVLAHAICRTFREVR